MAIKFTQDFSTKEEHPQHFQKGEVVDFYQLYEPDKSMPEEDAERNRRQRAAASENHFINRGVAARVEEAPAPQRGRTRPPEEKEPKAGEPATPHGQPGQPGQPSGQPGNQPGDRPGQHTGQPSGEQPKDQPRRAK